MPNAMTMIDAVATACSHGLSDFTPFADETHNLTMVPMAVMVRQISAYLVSQMKVDPMWIPHTNTFVLRYAEKEQARSGNFCAGFEISLDGRIHIAWDPCPTRMATFHSRMRATDWLAMELGKGDENNPSWIARIVLN